MKQLSKSHQKYQGRILSDSIISPQELALRKTRRDELGRRCREIFEQIRPELIEKYYNWFIDKHCLLRMTGGTLKFSA